MPKALVLLSLLLIALFPAHSQLSNDQNQVSNLITSQFNSLAGWHGGFEAIAGHQSGLIGFTGAQVDLIGGMNYYADKLNTGFNLVYGSRTLGQMNTTEINLGVAPKININNRIVFSPSLSFNYLTLRSRGFNNWFLVNGFPIGNIPDRSMLGFAIGTAIYRKDFFVASQLDLLARQGALDGNEAMFILGKSFKAKSTVLTPVINVQTDGTIHRISGSLNAEYNVFSLGVKQELMNQTTVAFGIDFKRKIRLSYSYSAYTFTQHTIIITP